MRDIRYQTIVVIAVTLLFGTGYSVLYNTYLDTSNPLLTHLAHALSGSHYFATKTNPLNVYFIKKAWGWTSLAFLFSYLTSPAQVRTKERFFKYLTLTAVWLLFTSWFFGPALLERVIVASGGQCVIALPNGDPITVPNEYCYSKSTITQQSHPDLFVTTFAIPPEWRLIPRLRMGHDISGHIFLLTMSTLFLVDQLRPSFKMGRWSSVHQWALASNIVLIAIWLFAIYTTGVYFHSPFEKLTGFLLGVASFAITQVPVFDVLSQPQTVEPQRVDKTPRQKPE
ncbi:inositol phospholipid synthesis and fat-storage-inducing TM-domain-containing protein [Crassisporium funariophilum]|nr:inositol phospholipid synthesis and fat-storage-inducing TM-domain-containing protein [Crassisporium funariophilum]